MRVGAHVGNPDPSGRSQRAIPDYGRHRALTDIYLHGIDHTSWVEATDDQDQQTFSNASSCYPRRGKVSDSDL